MITQAYIKTNKKKNNKSSVIWFLVLILLINFLFIYLFIFDAYYLNLIDFIYLEKEKINLDIMEMKKHSPIPKKLEEKSFFGLDEERKDRGKIFQDKLKKIPNELAKGNLERDEKKMPYGPMINGEELIESVKNALGYNTSPGSLMQESIQNLYRHTKLDDESREMIKEVRDFAVEEALRNTTKGTKDGTTDDMFSAEQQWFIHKIKKSPRK